MAQLFENPKELEGRVIAKYKLEECIGRGTVGVVFRAVREDIHDTVACKLIPQDNLNEEWQTELEKVSKLDGIENVVSYRFHGVEVINGEVFVYIFWQFIKGQNLRDYMDAKPDAITISFIRELVDQILQVFLAMEEVGISHGDLHEGNVLIADPDPRSYDQAPKIKVTDFGIAGSQTSFRPVDDYESLARICHKLLTRIDPSVLGGKERFLFYRLVSFLDKGILEQDRTVSDYVHNPRLLIDGVRGFDQEYRDKYSLPKLILKHPFDYLSCEQIGDDFDLLHTLYSVQFLGNRDLVERTNTVLTGPRGCGKTTIFRNLSLEAQLLAGTQQVGVLDDYIGVYYQCKDLYYAFPYLKEELTADVLKITVHYFNLAILFQVIDTLATLEEVSQETLSEAALAHLEGFFKSELPVYELAPKGTSKLRHMFDTIQRERSALKRKLESEQRSSISLSGRYLGLDFLKRFCGLLQQTIPWLKNRPFYFFLDDYSLPKISKPLQMSLNRVIFDRSAECYFKISTESVVTIYPYDADGKFLEEAREYDLIDLGDYFLFTGTREQRERLLVAIINNRLDKAEIIHADYKKIEDILGKTPYTYNGLAREIAEGKHIYYHGIDTLVDLCSGDIAYILEILRDMFAHVGGPEAFSRSGEVKIPLDPRIQDAAIRNFGNYFVNRIESLPPEGPHLREIMDAFGEVSHWYLCNRISKNEEGRPQWQAFRLEIRDKPKFDDAQLEKYYGDLIRYGVFIRDVRGKSQRGAVVPRLYLRRILVPTYRLTFNQRDSIGLEVEDFNVLLREPEKFVRTTKAKAGIPEEQRRMF